MHETAVILLCVLTVHFVWRDTMELFIAWYSGAEPPLSASSKVWIGVRSALGVSAVATAIATL
jgi:hypothetical protein